MFKKARVALEEVGSINPNDGPNKTITDVIREFHFKSPEGWPGYRELTEK
jgi:hypothetical protein